MKTAISIPDELFEEAEEVASRLGLSRSQLYVMAIAAYLKARRKEDVIRKLDEVYGDVSSALDPHLAAMQAASLPAEDW